MEIFQRTKIRTTTQPSNSECMSGYLPTKEKKSHKKDPFIVVLFTIAKSWNQPKCPSVVDWIKKMWSIYTMEY